MHAFGHLTGRGQDPPVAGGGATGRQQDLDRLLRTGPFHEALRAAVANSGLSLDRIQDRLRRRGAVISVPTLSSWQSGRYRPERAGSLAVLSALEEVLGVRPAALAALVGPPRPRGRRAAPPPDGRGLGATWEGKMDISSALSQVDTRWDHSLTRLSTHCRLELDEQGREKRMHSRQLLRADVDGPDRWVTVFRRDEAGPPPMISTVAPHRIGKVVESEANGLLVAEVLFDRELTRGESIIVEYTLEHRSPRPRSTELQSTLHVPVREYVLEVRFDPTALPASCHSFRSAEDDTRPQERLLKPDAAGSVLAVALAAGPCKLGIRWAWTATPGNGAE